MAYADYSFYADEYVGDAVTEAEWPLYSARASQLVDMLTRYQVQKQGLDSFPAFVQAQVKLAVCAQADYFAYMGIDLATTGRAGTGFTVGNVSVSYGMRYGSGNAQSAYGAGVSVAPAALGFLEQTGLLSREVSAPVDLFVPFPFLR